MNLLYSNEDILTRIRQLGHDITEDYRAEGKSRFSLVGVLRGAGPFLSQLMKSVPIVCVSSTVEAKSYVGQESTGKVVITEYWNGFIKGWDVLLVDDIVDTGYTLTAIMEKMLNEGARSIKVCTLLDKVSRRKVKVPVHYRGFEIPDKFVVGFGMDYKEKYRDLPGIYELDETGS